MRIGIIGATGSIGLQTLQVADAFPEKLRPTLLVAGRRTDLLTSLAAKYGASAYAASEGGLESSDFRQSLEQVDMLVYAASTVQHLGLLLDFLGQGKPVCLSTKEIIVEAWPFLSGFAPLIRPVDSEHSALWRLGAQGPFVRRLYVVGSGGSLRDLTKEQIEQVDLSSVMRHPVWHMGEKVTFDSAFLINKSMEVIEASHLFNVSADRIDIVIERSGNVHGIVDLCDGSRFLFASKPSMIIPIAYALFHPEVPSFEEQDSDILTQTLKLESPDFERFPCAKLGHLSLAFGYTSRMAFSVADEVAFHMFKRGLLKPSQIYELLEGAIITYQDWEYPSSIQEFFALRQEMVSRFTREVQKF